MINDELMQADQQTVLQKDDFYQALRRKIRNYLETEEGKKFKFAEYLLLAPDLFHLLCKLTIDKDVAIADKAKLAAAVAYFVSPIDIVPDILVPVGYLDDIALAAYVLNGILNNTSTEVVERHWSGEKNLLEAIKSILAVADTMIGSGAWGKIKGMFKNH